MALSKRVRFEVLRRDNNTCRYCHATDTPLTIDHVIPTALGGTDDPSNLVAACKDCNAGKSASNPDASLVAQVTDDAIRWAAAMRQAAAKASAERQAERERLEPVWEAWYALVPSYRVGNPYWEMPSNWRQTVTGFLNSGLPVEMLTEAVEIALTQRGVDDRFRYFIGVARNMLTKLQESAAAIVADDQPSAPPAESSVDAYWRGYVDSMLEPESKLARLNFRSLSRVVDGPQPWNAPLRVDA